MKLYLSPIFLKHLLFLPKVNIISPLFPLPEITHSFTKTDRWNEKNR